MPPTLTFPEQLEHLLQQPRMYYAPLAPQNCVAGLLDLIRYTQLPRDSTVLEVGSFAGVSAELFALYFDTVICVDTWMPYPEIKLERLQEARARFHDVLGRRPNVGKFPLESGRASTFFQDRSLDLVYIDAEHSYDACSRDIQLWLPKVKIGGWIAGHDICLSQVETAVFHNLHRFNQQQDNYQRFADSSWLVRVLFE